MYPQVHVYHFADVYLKGLLFIFPKLFHYFAFGGFQLWTKFEFKSNKICNEIGTHPNLNQNHSTYSAHSQISHGHHRFKSTSIHMSSQKLFSRLQLSQDG